jgi:chromate transporter
MYSWYPNSCLLKKSVLYKKYMQGIGVFSHFAKIVLFNFGGGYAMMISFLQNETVLRHAWITASEFTDIVAISQMPIGPLGINLDTYSGYVVSGNIFVAAGSRR